jgi:putative acetyltransferase
MIRAARPGEEEAILAVVTAAFTDATRDGSEERDIVRGTWAACPSDARVELVAEAAGEVVGHLLAAPGRLDGTPVDVVGVAPVCVGPDRQGGGIGRALMEALIAQAAERRWPMLVLLGDPAFYGRFGFERAGPLGITYAPAGVDSPHFLARRLAGRDPVLRGSFTYCWE